MSDPILRIRDLRVTFSGAGAKVPAVAGVDLDVSAGEVVALVGESGSGKSVCAQSVLGLHRGPGVTVEGSITYAGQELVGASEATLREVRGAGVGMVFQDPTTSLNPLTRVGAQVEEVLRLHTDLDRRARRERVVELLADVGIGDPADRARRYPHELSGGLRQRIGIAMALAAEPAVIVADEPTTALDVTVQAQILDLLATLRARHGTGLLLITHDLGVVAERADRVAVMYAGRIVEVAPTRTLFADPQHPYTWGLLASLPRLRGRRDAPLRPIAGAPPAPQNRPGGCAYRPRCPAAMERCTELPELTGDAERADACLLETADRPRQREAAMT